MTDYIDPATELLDNYGDPIPDPLIHIITLSRDDYDMAVDEINDRGGSTRGAAEYMAQWDNGIEDDRAATVNGASARADVQRWFLHETIRIDNIEYVVCWVHPLSTYALYRPPLTGTEE